MSDPTADATITALQSEIAELKAQLSEARDDLAHYEKHDRIRTISQKEKLRAACDLVEFTLRKHLREYEVAQLTIRRRKSVSANLDKTHFHEAETLYGAVRELEQELAHRA